jgi:hypothetical protein
MSNDLIGCECIVHTHEESHLVRVPDNLALDKLAVVTTVTHRSVIPFGTATSSFLIVTNSKSNSGSDFSRVK